jgi:hypothetical protein
MITYRQDTCIPIRGRNAARKRRSQALIGYWWEMMTNQPDDNNELDPKCGASPFNTPSIRSWCFSRIEVPEALLTPATIGSGPSEERAFELFLHRNKITPCQIDKDTDLLVIGREDWHCLSFRMLLVKRRDNMPRIYSQEMYFTYWATHDAPLEAPLDVIDAFVEGHPDLEYLSQRQEGWGSTEFRKKPTMS